MSPDHRYYLVFIEKLLCQLASKEIGTTPYLVLLHDSFAGPGLVVDGVGPNQVTEES